MKNSVVVKLSKLVGYFIKLFRLGSGSTWPGHVALAVNPKFIKDILENSNVHVVLIAGTNGKTTTSKLIRFVLEKNGYRVFQNEEGANLLNGIASSLIRHINLIGPLSKKEPVVAIFEVDENSLPITLKQIKPKSLLLLNLFRDQLDRYGEVNIIADKWQESLKNLTGETLLFLNGDDPQIAYLGKGIGASTHFYGINHKHLTLKDMPHDVDSTYCPQCGQRLSYSSMSYSHLGSYHCEKCGFGRPRVVTYADDLLSSSLNGIYNLYNITAAVLLMTTVFGIEIEDITKHLKEFKPAFGRQEQLEYKGRKITIQLSKNPAGFNQSVSVAQEIIEKNGGNILLVLNDRIPDGTDVSWIWDVEFEQIKTFTDVVYVSGDRVYDMALRMKYGGFEQIETEEALENAIEKVVSATPEGGNVVILCTYSAMLEVRKIILGRSLL